MPWCVRAARQINIDSRTCDFAVFQAAAAEAADCAHALEGIRSDLDRRICELEVDDTALVLLEQAEVFAAAGNRILIQLEITDDIPAGKHAGNAVQQTACAVQCLIAAQRRDAREADILAGRRPKARPRAAVP